MAFAGVTIDIVDKASRKLRGINDQTKKLTRSFTVLEKRNKGLTTRFNSLGKAIAAVGDLETISVSFVTNGTITNAV